MRQKNKAIFIDRDGVLNYEKSYIKSPEELELFPFSAKAIKKINNSEYLTIVITNQSGIARNLFTEETLFEIHEKLHLELKKANARIDKIYYCPHFPEASENYNKKFVRDCDCRKPKSRMLFQAAKDFNIDLSKSFMIGDSERDIIAGKNAGLTTILVKTGKNIQNIKQKPDFILDNLKVAVDYILSTNKS
ncbi:MAG: D-glycero-beta-D-manno-heptose 1,7-bisphosphate 7-phosphatase [Bacteroidetes bacterium]|jgi:D,D-heptose 1,7-bisphosphate phosphatase|nr:D-glycero-beta-D-manno-heptose 1,7-bisphosphate 7-phosphatase [Bacteroidota bacterium]MBT6686523.1 D-glycero-beta-D-manno-heptose 1,7-bisphosphate 7-phosphatase [Bacteroidota bacterium]MBT7143418.1 D-glycero-beta-D-manno-heptose 1,7-bisphosphate 7-phosphatase [Bacteroidota bacterium]MBT7493528.1 D-glycero-beta-D-manno-heptose 1,7-bisphosphate 7-phosphatase [Bacteroidota bacterium]